MIANPRFGFQVSVEGAGSTWSENSRENQLTPWSNDPVSDRTGEVLYLRDDDSGELWGPTALPIRDESARYLARHGQGYSRFEHTSHGIAQELLQYVPLDDPIKISRLTLRNLSGRTRRLSVTGVRRVGARHVAQRVRAFRRDGDRPALGGALRAESVECSVRRARRVRGPPRPAALVDRGPHRVPRTQRSAGRAGCPRARRRAVESRRRGPGPVRSAADRVRAARKRADRGGLPAGPGRGHDRSPRSAGSLSHGRSRRRAAQRHRPLGGDARNGAGQDTGSVHGPPAQSLAPVPDARLSGLGPLRLLSGQRSVRLSRPAPGRDGARDREARSHARAPPARRRAPVRRGRRPALVAASLGRRCSHADLRRPRLAALRGRALSRRNGGPGRARRARAVPRGRAAPRRRERRLLPAHDLGRDRDALRALRARSRRESRGRAATAFRSSGPATGTTA